MKAFIVAIVLAVVLAAAAGFVLEGYFSRDAEVAFSTPSARVGHESTVEARRFSGEGVPAGEGAATAPAR